MTPRVHHSAAQRLALLLGLFASAAGAAELDEKVLGLTLTEREAMAEQHLKDKLESWKRRLQLEDWDIAIVLSRSEEPRPQTLGNIKWDPERMRARIRVLRASEYKADFPEALKDMEFTVVHELIHLTLSRLSRAEAERSEEERAINHLTDALLERGGSR